MSRWRSVLGGRTALRLLCAVTLCALSLGTFFLGRAITRGVIAEQMNRNGVSASSAAVERLAARESVAATLLLVVGVAAGIVAFVSRQVSTAVPSRGATLGFAALLFCGSAGMLFYGLALPAW